MTRTKHENATVRAGVIGTGTIGREHLHRLHSVVPGVSVRSIFDVDSERAAALAGEVGAVLRARAEDVIDDPEVDAVVIASPGETHAELTKACIAAGKPVLCEKPLAPDVAECRDVVELEAKHGERLVQVGFMRRYDPGYLELKGQLDRGAIGERLLVHCLHRNLVSPPGFTSAMSLTDSVVHEIDAARWLLGEEIVRVTVVPVRRSPLAPENLRDPQLVLLEAESGAVVDVEVFVNCQYGYDVRCEVVGALGTVSLGAPSAITTNRDGRCEVAVPEGWQARFATAYRDELQDWVESVRLGTARGPTAWDGYAATAVAQACVESLVSGSAVSVALDTRPGIYE